MQKTPPAKDEKTKKKNKNKGEKKKKKDYEIRRADKIEQQPK